MMELDEVTISRMIIESFSRKLVNALKVDVAIVGGGPSGMVCGYYLAKAGKNVVLFERKLSIGGGMWGGGMMFNEIVFQGSAMPVLNEFDIQTRRYVNDYYTADAVEAVSTICSKAVKAGLKIFNLMSVEDVMIREQRVCGLVLNWSAVEAARLHVDPITMRAGYVVDATGHPAEVARIVADKSGLSLETGSGKLQGEQSMWAEQGEAAILQNSKEVCPGFYVCGMCANAVLGGPRMGPIFGGMVLSGEKTAKMLLEQLDRV